MPDIFTLENKIKQMIDEMKDSARPTDYPIRQGKKLLSLLYFFINF